MACERSRPEFFSSPLLAALLKNPSPRRGGGRPSPFGLSAAVRLRRRKKNIAGTWPGGEENSCHLDGPQV